MVGQVVRAILGEAFRRRLRCGWITPFLVGYVLRDALGEQGSLERLRRRLQGKTEPPPPPANESVPKATE